MGIVYALLAGTLFGTGLIASQMTDPLKVKGFLDLLGVWDPSLALVMAVAIAVSFVAFSTARRRKLSWSGTPINLPASSRVDKRLLLGGALFGIGWGIAGLCPGPALVAAASGSLPAIGFVGAMLVGMALHDYKRLGRSADKGYRGLFKVHMDEGVVDYKIRAATNGNYVLGTHRFQEVIGRMLGRRVTKGRAGRPVEKASED